MVTHDPARFAGLAREFLGGGLSRNLLATILEGVLARRPEPASRPTFACALDGSGGVTAAALRTPPWPMIVTGFEDRELARELARLWLRADAGVDAVTGEPPGAGIIAGALARHSGRGARLRMREAMHVLTNVVEPARPAGGRLRPAREEDRPLLVEWEEAFVAEAHVGMAGAGERTVAARMADGRQFVWDDGGPACSLAASTQVAGTVRIGPVYTPPPRRRRGYATSAVAALARRALDGGAERCMLFTDLANPTSNRIYADVGFRRCGDWEEHELLAEPTGSRAGAAANPARAPLGTARRASAAHGKATPPPRAPRGR